MTSVCYLVDFLIHTPEQGPKIEHIMFFGPLEDVLKDLATAETAQRQAIIVHAADDILVATHRTRLQIINQLQTHDLATLPEYPTFGSGTAQFKDPDGKAMFKVQIKVSRRGPPPVTDVTVPSNIILPPGV